jgi:hypothetical protein
MMMANERSGRMINSSERGELGFWQTALNGVIVALIGAALVGGIALLTNERIERPTAERFLREYYEKAVPAADRDHAWNMLTVSFQENEDKLREGSLRGREAYDVFFGRLREVQVGHVDKVSGEPDWFETNLTYISKTGRRSIEKTHFKLVCSWFIKKNPFRNCKPENIQIQDSVVKESGDG